MNCHYFGIRHHGPGCARSLSKALAALQPDVILIEGPPEADSILHWGLDPQMKPPMALLVYAVDDPTQAVFYPYAEFSPEWQAVKYGLQQGITVRFMDLPQQYQFSMNEQTRHSPNKDITQDPVVYLAQAAGFTDGERYWSHLVEERRNDEKIFSSINSAMTELRIGHGLGRNISPMERMREAYMRKIIRQTGKKAQRLAVVCGAWHVPALQQPPPVKEDSNLLKNLSKIKTLATWCPWSYSRLLLSSGYGAGIKAPGWYEHLWETSTEIAPVWLSKVAQLLRSHSTTVSTADIISALQTAENLTVIRDRTAVGLNELQDAVECSLLAGDKSLLGIIEQKLVIGEKTGEVPAHVPNVPLEKDINYNINRLRLKRDDKKSVILLDLRKTADLQKSRLLRRLMLLEIPWGQGGERAGGLGTFKEAWTLQWKPEFTLFIIEASMWGASLESAVEAKTRHRVLTVDKLEQLVELAQQALFADLSAVIDDITNKIANVSATTATLLELMTVIPELVQLSRYGDVRQTAVSNVKKIVEKMFVRINVELAGVCVGLTEDAAEETIKAIRQVHSSIALIDNFELAQSWFQALESLSQYDDVHPMVHGQCIRLLLESGFLEKGAVIQNVELVMSSAQPPLRSALWLDGFIRGAVYRLVYDHELLAVIDQWLNSLTDEKFKQVLPLLRRGFSRFSSSELNRIEMQISSKSDHLDPGDDQVFDVAQAESILPTLQTLLGRNHD